MTVIINNRTDPYFNLAAEEALLTLSHEGIVIVWRNSPAVVIGRNQTHTRRSGAHMQRKTE